MTHKLTTFILAQHKKNKESAAKEKKKGDTTGDVSKIEKEKKSSKKDKKDKVVEDSVDKKASRKKSSSPGPDSAATNEVDALATCVEDSLSLAAAEEISATGRPSAVVSVDIGGIDDSLQA